MATQNTDLKEAKKDAIMTPDMYRSMFLRQFTSQCSQSYDKMMAMGFMYTIQKPLRKIYPNDDDYYAALDRHTEFFNITPHVLPFVAGLTVSMEEQAAADKNFDTSSINAMKVGLMGPLSGHWRFVLLGYVPRGRRRHWYWHRFDGQPARPHRVRAHLLRD